MILSMPAMACMKLILNEERLQFHFPYSITQFLQSKGERDQNGI